MPDAKTNSKLFKTKFSSAFWVANSVELLERLADRRDVGQKRLAACALLRDGRRARCDGFRDRCFAATRRKDRREVAAPAWQDAAH